MNVLQRIMHLRQQRGWSTYRLAEESDMKQTTISTWYRDDAEPKISSIEKLCAGFGIPLAQFFAEEEDIIALTEEEKQLVAAFRLLNHEQRERTVALLEVMHDPKRKQQSLPKLPK